MVVVASAGIDGIGFGNGTCIPASGNRFVRQCCGGWIAGRISNVSECSGVGSVGEAAWDVGYFDSLDAGGWVMGSGELLWVGGAKAFG